MQDVIQHRLLRDVAKIQKVTQQKPRSWAERAFRALDTESRGFIFPDELIKQIKQSGSYTNNQLAQLILDLEGISGSISFEKFEVLIHGKNFIKKVLEHNLVIPNYKIFHQNFLRCHEEIKSDSKYSWGEKASYIPSLYKANEKWWGSAFCSADG